jgi:PQQ-dependent dehydrogenase (methanol/ethanol family)
MARSVRFRHAAAFLLAAAVIAAVALPFAVAQEAAHVPTNPFAADASAADAGKGMFQATCVACHGAGGVGTERAPSLRGAIVRGGTDFDVFETIQKGVPGTVMPSFSSFKAEDLWRLVTYVRSLSAQPGNASAQATPASGDAANGERVFFAEGCSGCHELNGRGAIFAADLSAVGARPMANVREGVVHSNLPRRATPFRLDTVILRDGSRHEGLILNRDAFALNLQRRDGSFALLDSAEVQSITPVPGTDVPTDTAQRLGSKAVDDLTAYLLTQKTRAFDLIAKLTLPEGLTGERIAATPRRSGNWPTYWGDYHSHHFSELAQITTANVSSLQGRWAAVLPGPVPLQASPIVIDGIMYVSGPPGYVYALNAKTGQQLWKYYRKQDVLNPYQINPSNRGVAVLGSRVFFNTLDNNLIALDARSGRQLWEKRLGDTMRGMTLTGAPLALKDRIIVGMSGGEGGVNGFLEAFDPASGNKLWHLDTIPGPGQPGHDTWLGDSWKNAGGATWLTGSYDPELNLLYWATGNPGPDFDSDIRRGDNLYTCSALAINPDTGKLVWWFQFTPNDSHDWDAVQNLVLADRMIDGKPRKLLLQANRNGFFYVLDRVTGKFISGTAFVQQTWNAGFDKNGRPKVRPETISTEKGVRVYPQSATNFQAPSYDEQNGVYYVAYRDSEGFGNYARSNFEPGKLYFGTGNATPLKPLRDPMLGIKALDVGTGATLWNFPLSRSGAQPGLLGTRGGVLFAASAEGWFVGLDSKTGKPLWKFNTGGPIGASPMTYTVGGEQFVALAAGNTVYAMALPK